MFSKTSTNMTLPFPDLINILKVLSPNALPKRLNPTVLVAWIQERSQIPLDELDSQYKEGKKELTDKLVGLGYSGDVKKLHLNELWVLLGELESKTLDNRQVLEANIASD